MKPKVLKGMRDLLPESMRRRNFIVSRLEEVFSHYGFQPLQTPAMEYFEVLNNKYGEEGERLLYHFHDQGNRHVGLRYDLTVPLARVVSMHPNLPKPFRRYQIAPVWRAEKPHKGRFREFYQCDIDVVGSSSAMVDAELIALLGQGMAALGIENYVIQVNNRKILDAVSELVGLNPERTPDLCRSLDKLEKIGQEGVEKELLELGLTETAIQQVFKVLAVEGSLIECLEQLGDSLQMILKGAEGLLELAQLFQHVLASEIDPACLVLNPTLARGMDYYTGTIFEIVSTDVQVGSLGGGGRYDGLIGTLGGQLLPAAGASFGLDRLQIVLEESGLFPVEELDRVQVFITLFDEQSSVDVMWICQQLRGAGIRTEMSYESNKLGKQFKHADRVGARCAIIAGPEERESGQVAVKDLRTGNQETVPMANLIEYLQKLLNAPPA